jgi:hypothetical protein
MSGGKNWSGSNWTASHWDGSNWLGPNDSGGGTTYADMAAVLTGSATVTAGINAVPEVVRDLLRFAADTSLTRNDIVQAERKRNTERAARDMNDITMILSVLATADMDD